MMEFNNIDWADSNIEKIEIEYDSIKLYIFNDTLQRNVCVICTGFIGVTDLCIWDDQIIDYADARQIADDENIPFMKMVYASYDKNFNYGERYLNNGVIEVCIRLINNIPFNIYCQKITVEYI